MYGTAAYRALVCTHVVVLGLTRLCISLDLYLISHYSC